VVAALDRGLFEQWRAWVAAHLPEGRKQHRT
jgi:hypothetical protein